MVVVLRKSSGRIESHLLESSVFSFLGTLTTHPDKMIKLFSLKQQKKDGEPTNSKNTKKSAAVLRLTKGKQKWLPAKKKKKIFFCGFFAS